MLKRFLSRREERRVQDLVDFLTTWHRTCLTVSEICGEALYDESLPQREIGEVLDRADRQLFQFRNQTIEARAAVRRYERDLASRIDSVADGVYRLRNLTTRFLIRAQGPGPFAGGPVTDVQLSQSYYYRALDDVGYEARQVKTSLDAEISTLWRDLDALLKSVSAR